MKSLFIFAFTAFFTGSLAAQVPAITPHQTAVLASQPLPQAAPAIAPTASPAPVTSAAPLATRQQKLEKFWKLYEQNYGLGALTLKGYKLKSPPNETERLDDSKVQENALAEIGRAFSVKAGELFSDAELDYLIQLYSNPVSKKISQLETQFWRSDVTSPIISRTLESLEAKPAAPAVPSLAPTSTPIPAPKK